MQTEIEIKLELTPKIEKIIAAFLKENSKIEKETHHIEYYLDNPKSTFFIKSKEGFKDAIDYLRVRFTKKGDSICLKHWIRDKKTGKTTHCDEYETKVESGQITLELLEQIGFTNNTKIDKTRKIYNYKDFEIAIDSVKGLGKFMEVELKKKVKQPKDGIKEIYNFLLSLDIKTINKMERGYVSMMWNKEYDFGEKINLASEVL